MEDHSPFLNQLRRKALRMREHARAEGQSTPPEQHNTANAPTEKLDAQDASEKQENSGEDTPVDMDAPRCNCCAERDTKGNITKPGLPLIRLSYKITREGFQKSGLPIYLCEVCDGEALTLAQRQTEYE